MADGDRPKQSERPEKPLQPESTTSCRSRKKHSEDKQTCVSQPRTASQPVSTPAPESQRSDSKTSRSPTSVTFSRNQESSATQTTASKSPVGSCPTSVTQLSDKIPSSSDKQFSPTSQPSSDAPTTSVTQTAAESSVSHTKSSDWQQHSPPVRNLDPSSTPSEPVSTPDYQAVTSSDGLRRKSTSPAANIPPSYSRPISRPTSWAFQQPASQPSFHSHKPSTRLSKPLSSNQELAATVSKPESIYPTKSDSSSASLTASPTNKLQASQTVTQPSSLDFPTWITSSTNIADKSVPKSKPDSKLRRLSFPDPQTQTTVDPPTQTEAPPSFSKWWPWSLANIPPSTKPDLSSTPSPSDLDPSALVAPPSSQTEVRHIFTKWWSWSSTTTPPSSKIDISSSPSSLDASSPVAPSSSQTEVRHILTKWWPWSSTTTPPSSKIDISSSPLSLDASSPVAPSSSQTEVRHIFTKWWPWSSTTTPPSSKTDISSSPSSLDASSPVAPSSSQIEVPPLFTKCFPWILVPSIPPASKTDSSSSSSITALTSPLSKGILSYLWASFSSSSSRPVKSPSLTEAATKSSSSTLITENTIESQIDSSSSTISLPNPNVVPPSIETEIEASSTIWVPWGLSTKKYQKTLSPSSPSSASPIPPLLQPTSSTKMTKPSERRITFDSSISTTSHREKQVRTRSYPSPNGSASDIFNLLSFSLFQQYEGMAPPYYADLGKKANDVFSKGYHFGVFKLDLKTKSESGVEFASGIISNQESGKVFGSLSSKYAVKDYGLTFTEKWNTDNTLATDITIQDQIAAGLKITLEGTFAPQTGSKTGKLKTSFANDTVAVNTNFDLDLAGPIVDVAAVLNYQGWLAGVHGQFDSQKAKFSKNNFALGFQSNDFSLHTNVDNGKDFGGSIYQKVSDKIDCGISMKWTAGSADTLFGVGAKFALDADASLHAKINNKSLIGLGYQQKLRPGVTLTLSAAIDGQNFNAGGHKVGVALELEP